MNLNLIIDSSYIFYRNVYTLSSTNTLFGDLEDALRNSFDHYRTQYPFSNVYIVSDSKNYWRKKAS